MAIPQAASRPFWRCFAAMLLALSGMPPAQAGQQQLVSDPATLKFGRVVVGQVATLPVTLTNRGQSEITISTISIDTSAFSVNNLILPLTLAAGQKVDFTVSFSPATSGDNDGVIEFFSDLVSGTLTLPAHGQGVDDWNLTADPPNLAFGNVAVGSRVTLPLSVVNNGTSSATIESGELVGNGFKVNGINLPLTLDAGQWFTFSVSFRPQDKGPAKGRILATGPRHPILNVPLDGYGTDAGTLVVAPATLDFGTVTIGYSGHRTGTLSAIGADVTVSSVTSSNSEFLISGMSLPLTIPAGQNYNYAVTFSPQSSGDESATLSIISTASNSPTQQALTGTGTQPTPHTVSLSWDASKSQILGYNIYRGTSSGGPYWRLNSVLDPDTTYLDDTITGAQTYYYVTTAVNAIGEESGYSNEVKVAIAIP